MIKARLLGEFEVEMNGQPVGRFRTRKAALLLAYLLRYPQRHPRERLLRLFWNGLPKEAAQNNLRVALSVLKRILEPPSVPAGSVVWSDRHTVGLNPELLKTDAAAFEEALQRAANAPNPDEQRHWLERACSLYQGDFLTGFEEPWVQTERERLRLLYQEALQQLQPAGAKTLPTPRVASPFSVSNPPCGLGVVLGLESKTPLQQRNWARQVITVSPGFVFEATATGMRAFFSSLEGALKALDSLHRQLSECHFALDVGEIRYHLGRYGGMPLTTVEQLLQAGSAGQILCTERAALLLPQGRATTRFVLRHLGCYRLSEQGGNEQVYQLELAGRSRLFAPLRALSPVRKWLLQVPTSFIGREMELMQLRMWLQRGEETLITVVGPPGVGKSRLALECAWHSEELFGEARWWLTVQHESDPLAELLARRLEWEWHGWEPLVNSLRAMLDAQRALLVLDVGGELSETQKEELKSLREAVPELSCLVASPLPLGIKGERVFRLEPLPVPPIGEEEVGVLLQYPAVQMFLDRAQRVMPDFRLTERNAGVVSALCRQLEGLPLAIELVAARVGSRPLEAIKEQWSRSVRWLSDRPIGTLGRSLTASLQVTYRLLSPEVQAFLARLSVLRGNWSMAAAQAIASPPEATEALAELARVSLIQPVGERYRLLEPVRLYAAEQLQRLGEWERVSSAHLDYYWALASSQGNKVESWDLLDQERTNMEAALAWGVQHAPERALSLAAGLIPFWERRGCGQASYQTVCQLPERLEETENRLQAARIAIRLAIRRGEMEQAQQLLQQFLPLADSLPASIEAARMWTAAGFYYWAQGNHEKSMAYLQRAIRLCQALHEPLDQAEALIHLGIALWIQGEHQASACTLEQALELTPGTAPVLRLKAMSNLANCFYYQGQWERAEVCLKKTLEVACRIGDRRTMATLLTNWGVWLRDRGEYARARELCLQAIALWQELHEGMGEAATLNNLADLALLEGDHEAAAALLHRSLQCILRYRLFWYLPKILQNLAALREQQREQAQAEDWQKVRLFASLLYGQEKEIAPTLQTLAQLALKRDDPVAAIRWLMLMEPIAGVPCPSDQFTPLQERLPPELLNQLRQEATQTSREQLLEHLSPLANQLLTLSS